MKNVIITILAILVLGLGGYLVYDKVVNKETPSINKNEEKQEEVKEESYDLVEAKKLVDKYYLNHFFGGNSFNGYTDEVKIWLAYNSLSETQQSTVNCAELYEGKENVTKDPQGYILENKRTCDGEAKTVTYDNMSKAYKSFFGNNVELKKEDISQFDYNEEKDIFILLGCRCGGADTSIYIYDVKTAKQIGNNLIVEVGYSVIIDNYYNGESHYYSNVDSSVIYTLDEVNQEEFEDNFIKKYLDVMDTYKFTFVKENDHYILDTAVKVLK